MIRSIYYKLTKENEELKYRKKCSPIPVRWGNKAENVPSFTLEHTQLNDIFKLISFTTCWTGQRLRSCFPILHLPWCLWSFSFFFFFCPSHMRIPIKYFSSPGMSLLFLFNFPVFTNFSKSCLLIYPRTYDCSFFL